LNLVGNIYLIQQNKARRLNRSIFIYIFCSNISREIADCQFDLS